MPMSRRRHIPAFSRRSLPGHRRVSWLGTVLLSLCGPVASQLLYEPVLDYEENYARTGYREYTASLWSQTTFPVYDELGNYLMSGTEIWRSEETRPTENLIPGSAINKASGYTSLVSQLMVANDSYKNWKSRLIIGDRIRTKFTGLTLDLAQLNGVRWDIDLNPTRATLVSSRYDWPNYADRYRDDSLHGQRQETTQLLGGHVAREFGVLELSLSYVNLFRTDSFVDWGDNSLKGVLPSRINQPPAYIAVKISDGSEDDGLGARVFDLRVEGPLNDDVEVSITRHDSRQIDPRFPNGDRYFRPGREIPPYLDFLRGKAPFEEPGAQEFLEANGSEYLVYWFKIPHEMRDKVESVRFKALVANDYRISLSEIFLPLSMEVTSNPNPDVVRATYLQDVAAQEGNVQDASNRRWVTFEYGRQSGRTTASFRLELEREGIQLSSEFARTFNFLQYPSSPGKRAWRRETADAFFIHGKKQFDGLTLAAEYFRLDPLYSTSLAVLNRDYSSYSDVEGSPFAGEVFPNFQDRFNDTIILDTVDDNDDKDLWPDSHFLNTTFGDQDGVFPALDSDQNGRTDVNENDNAEPDYIEPFFLYEVDPLEYDYGDDQNNNGVIDHREDDFNPDYPYDVDQKGYHLFATVEPFRALKLSLGRYRTQQIWGPGESRASYFRTSYRRTIFPYASVDFSNFLKRVRDDIEDDTPQFGYFTPHGIPNDPASIATTDISNIVAVEDPLLMRNSLVNTAYLDGTFIKIRDLRINNRLKQTVNFQRATAGQSANTISEWAWVLRGDYTWRLGQLSIAPKAKYMVYRRRDGEDQVHPISERFFYPMVMATLSLTTQTSLSAGAQGFPLLESTYRNPINPEVDYNSKDYIVSVTNRTTYEGYYLSLNLGYHLKRLKFRDRLRRSQDVDRSLFYVRLFMGLEPFEG